jgi:hypothetical protein
MPGMEPTLLVLAAGIGSRYGGLKQIDPVGPGGETIIDYSVYDAMRGGFRKLAFVIRRDIEKDFREAVGARFERKLPVEYVFQELEMVPGGLRVPPRRKKPWGTGHAILVAQNAVREPFAAINADDFYGRRAFQILADHLRSGGADYAMVGYVLRKTLSEFGSVARGVCRCGADGFLEAVTEMLRIERADGGAKHTDESGATHRLTGDEIVSMNFWGFTPTIFGHLRREFSAFLNTHGDNEKAEFLIPTVVNTLVASGQARVKVLRTTDTWLGMTYREDKPRVAASVRDLVARGEYPERLWA